MIHIVYLLGGNSQRFHKNKLLHPLKQQHLFQYGYDVLLQLVCSRDDCTFTVVTQYIQIQKLIPEYCILDEECKKGLSYTIKAALKDIKINENDYVMFVVGDQPFINQKTINKLIDQMQLSDNLVGCVGYHGQLGNPVIFHGSLIDELMNLQDDQGGKKVYMKHLDKSMVIEVDNINELYDIDEIDDLKDLR